MKVPRSTLSILRNLPWRWLALLCLLAALGLAHPISFALSPEAVRAQQRDHPRVLVLHSYHEGYGWTDSIQSGLGPELERLAPAAHVSVEYMDAHRLPPERGFPLLLDYFERKYDDYHPVAVIATDDAAVDFLLAYGKRLFHGAPVLFCGVGDVSAKHLPPGYTGVFERTDLGATVDAALALVPSLRKIALITGASENGENARRLFREAMATRADRLESEELCALPYAELASRLTTLTPGTAVLFMGLERDPTGETMSVDEALRFIRQRTELPVFTAWEFVVGKGPVGGVVVNGRRQGQTLATLAARVLMGEDVRKLPLQVTSPSVGMFDYTELERLGLSVSRLPKGSIVLNQPPSLWAGHRTLVILSSLAFALMALAIACLMLSIRRRRRAEAGQNMERTRFKQFVEALGVGVYETDLAGRIVFANMAGHELVGLAAGTMAGRDLLSLAHDDEARATITRLLNSEHDGRPDGQHGGRPGVSLVRLRKSSGQVAEVKLDRIRLIGEHGTISGYLVAATDLTQLREHEREREEQHRFTNALLDANPTPISAKDSDGRYVQVNRAMCAFLGRAPGEVLGHRLAELVEPELAALDAQLDEELYDSRGSLAVETTTRDASGNLRSVILTRSLHLDAMGRPLGVVGTLTDITAQKQAEADLLESREKYRTMFENLPLAVAVTGPDGRLLEANRSFEELHQTPREELMGLAPELRRYGLRRLDGAQVPPDQYPSVLAARDQKLVQQELFLQRPDGSTACVQSTAAPLPLPGYGAVVALVDMTERRRMEQIIKSRLDAVTSPPGQETNLDFFDLFDAADIQAVQDAFAAATGVGSVITDADGAALTRPSAIGAGCAMLHCPGSPVGSLACCTLALPGPPPEFLPGLLAADAPIMVGERLIARWRVLAAHKLDIDGVAKDLATRGWKLDTARRCLASVPGDMAPERFATVHGALGLMAGKLSELALRLVQQARSITRQRRIEADLQQAKDAAEAASRAKSDFLANVSHEIRTPLHGLLGMLQLLNMSPMNDDQTLYLEKATYSARSLLTVISDILDFSKIESGTLTLSSEAFNPAQLVRSCAAVLEEQARAKGLALNVEVDPDMPRMLLGDAGKIRQMLFNLAGNAVKFTDQGSVTILLSFIQPEHNRCVLLLEVRDTGVGIPEDLQDMVFEPFTQAEAVYTKRFQGTGLGLAIVRRLAGLMEGGITLESAPGRGTTVSLALRLDRPQGAVRAKDPTPPLPASLPPLRLLLAEDNLISQMAARSLLTREGHAVVCVANGQEALDALENSHFDAVLMDIQMPVMDGVTATRRIREHDGSHYDPNLPVLAITAYALAGEQQSFLDAGMDEAIAKPLEPQDITLALARVMARRGATPQPQS